MFSSFFRGLVIPFQKDCEIIELHFRNKIFDFIKVIKFLIQKGTRIINSCVNTEPDLTIFELCPLVLLEQE